MNVLFDASPDTANEPVLLVMLPGVNDRIPSFFTHGIVQALRERHLPVDALGIDADFPVYADGSLLPMLQTQIAKIRHRRGTTRLWFLGTSLGGMGSLMYCREHPGSVEGVVLLAPYLGSRRVLTHIDKLGGLDAWRPAQDEPGDMEWRVLDWLRGDLRNASSTLRIHLGYGHDDPFALGSTLLEAMLPEPCVIDIPGGHDWPTWSALWNRILDRKPFEAGLPRAI